MTVTQEPEAGRGSVSYLTDRNEKIEKPPGPFLGFWSMWYIDRFRVAKIMLGHLGIGAESYIKKLYDKFPTFLAPTDEFPEIELETAQGARINTGDFKGKKHFVLMSGAMT